MKRKDVLVTKKTCSGHGQCLTSLQTCICDAGWSGKPFCLNCTLQSHLITTFCLLYRAYEMKTIQYTIVHLTKRKPFLGRLQS